MTTAERIRLCRMIEKIEKNKEYAASLEVENTSGFRGIRIVQTGFRMILPDYWW